MQITFEQFILLFNNLSKLLYHELNGTATKQRIFCSNYTDHEFDIVHIINDDIKRSNIKEKYNIPIKQNVVLTIFVVDEVESMNGYHHPSHIEKSIFENGNNTLTIVVTTSIKDISEPSKLHYLYAGIIRAILEFTCESVNEKFIINPDTEEVVSARDILPSILASVIIDYTEYDFCDVYVKKILESTKSNCDYIQLIADVSLLIYLDSILI